VAGGSSGVEWQDAPAHPIVRGEREAVKEEFGIRDLGLPGDAPAPYDRPSPETSTRAPAPLSSLLLTGFLPWGAHAENPSAILAERLDGARIGDATARALVLPVDLERSWGALEEALETAGDPPLAILSLGLAARRRVMCLETRGANLTRFREPDVAGRRPDEGPLVPGAPPHLPATYPNRRALAALEAARVPARLSRDAGGFICNALLYRALLRHRNAPSVPAGFLHIPPASRIALEVQEQAVRIVLAAALPAGDAA
jgi:pyroglutamyl-peptidase